MTPEKVKIKVIRDNDVGIEKGTVLEARIIQGMLMGMDKYQILTDGPHLGDFIPWIEAVEV